MCNHFVSVTPTMNRLHSLYTVPIAQVLFFQLFRDCVFDDLSKRESTINIV